MVDGIWRGPDRPGGWRVISPTDSPVVEQVHQCQMVETRIHLLRLAAAGIYHIDGFGRRGSAPGVVTGVRNSTRILGREQIAVLAWRRSPGNDELVRGEAGALVGLEHAITESVLFRQLEVGIQDPGRIVDI